jgi:putative FmdB family regulatory protein
MPIFEFVCQKCGKEFERLVFRSNETVQCPDCGEASVNRLMSACSAKVGAKFTSGSKPAAASSCSGCSSNSCSSCH